VCTALRHCRQNVLLSEVSGKAGVSRVKYEIGHAGTYRAISVEYRVMQGTQRNVGLIQENNGE
jgi:hypothetical protein